jgi:hypothetical protein
MAAGLRVHPVQHYRLHDNDTGVISNRVAGRGATGFGPVDAGGKKAAVLP